MTCPRSFKKKKKKKSMAKPEIEPSVCFSCQYTPLSIKAVFESTGSPELQTHKRKTG